LNEQLRSGRADMEAMFLQAGLAAPPVPDAFADALFAQGTWTWGTEDLSAISLYSPFEPLLEFARNRDVLAVAHAGHGVSSYAITYLLGLGPLVVGAQIPWGGAYQDAERTAADVAKRFEQIARLVEVAEATPRSAKRLVVVHSGLFAMRSLGWVMDDEALPKSLIEEHRIEEDEFELALQHARGFERPRGGDAAR
jgi:hypothetical protein